MNMNRYLFKPFNTVPFRLKLPIFSLAYTLLMPSMLHAEEFCEPRQGDQIGYQRIVSVGGAITETIYALGQGHRIVASDTTSYYPPLAAKTPKVGYQRALSAEGILSAKPDLIIASDQAGPEKVMAQLRATKLRLVILPTANSLDQVIQNIDQLGSTLCSKKESDNLIASIESKHRQFPRLVSGNKQRVLFIMQHNGGAPMVAGASTSAASIIQLSGAINAVNDFDGYKPLTPEALLFAKPDVILTTNLGNDQANSHEDILSLPGVSLTPAGDSKSIISMDSLLLLGFSPRTVEAAELLYQKLYTTF